MKNLLTVKEAAQELTLSPKTMRMWVFYKKIETIRIGGSVRIPSTEIARIIESGRTEAVGRG